MCMACGQMFSSIHWSDRLKTDEKGFVDQRVLLRTRQMKVSVTNKILGYYGLSVRNRPGGGYTVMNRTGRALLCKDFGDLWFQVQKLCGKTVDPLDPDLLSYLEAKTDQEDV